MKKNIIIFYPSYERGGVTKTLYNLLKSQNLKDINIHVICSLNFIRKIKKNNIFFHSYKIKRRIFFIPFRFISAFYAMNKLKDLITKKEINQNVIVHSMQSNIAAIITCIFTRTKIIIRNSENSLYSAINSENKFYGLIVFVLKFMFYNFSHGAITNSLGSAKSLGIFFFNKSKIKTIYNPIIKSINIKKYKKNNTILNIGRLRKQKDHFTLLRAFKIFSNKNRNYRLIILGHGNLKNKLKQLTKNLNLEKKVIFKGWVKNPDKYLKKSKLFVLSSVYEGLGNVLLDAINFDTPCVSTNCPSGPDEILLNGRGGYLVRPNSPHELAQKMLYAIDNYETSNNKNKIAKSKLNRFLIKQNSTYYFNHLLTFFNDKK